MKADSFTLDLERVHNFNDDVTVDFNAQLQGIVADCRKRPGCNKARKVTLKIEATPNEQDSDDVDVTMTVTSSIPAAKHIARRARTNSKNQLQLSFDDSDYLYEEDEDDE